MMRYHKANPAIYYVICAAAMGVVVVYIVTAMAGRKSAAKSGRPSVSDSSAAVSEKNGIEGDEDGVDDEEDEGDASWKLLLVNRRHSLPDDYEKNLELVKIRGDISVDQRIYDDLQQMMDDCRAEGLSPMVCSGYRSVEKQQTLFDNKVRTYIGQGYSQTAAYAEAEKWITVPGTSEHHTGMAVDIVAESYQLLEKDQEDTGEQKWLMAHCEQYGFILRYPEDKVEITGIHYEPWHYRYVGKKAAKYIKAHGLCLEEYLQQTGTAQSAKSSGS